MRRFFKRMNLTFTLVLYVFLIMIASALIVSTAAFVLFHVSEISYTDIPAGRPGIGRDRFWFMPLMLILGFSTFIGTALAAILSSRTLKPIKNVISATQEVARGNFDVRVNISGIGELEDLAHSFNKMVQELSGIETLRSDFVNNFSHEFKTPIVSIRGFAKLLKDAELDDSEREEYIGIIIQESERLANLSTNVLKLSKLDSLEIISEKREYRLDEQIRQVVALLEPKWSAKNLTVSVEMEDITYCGNDDIMQQMWLNLVDNAIKFSYNGGCVSIYLSGAANGVVFTIQNEGCGMDEETMAHIFERFYQGDSSRRQDGNGIGLSLAKRIADLCGGALYVESEPAKGAVFSVTLPYHY